MLPSSRPGSKTNFVVAKLYVHFYAAAVLVCVQMIALQTVHKNALNLKQYLEFMAVANVCYHMRILVGSKWENMVAFATKIQRILSPVVH